MQLSIIIPIYNVEDYIRLCLESAYQQGLDENSFEVILVNDGTKDNSMGVINDIVSSHRNIIIKNQTNQGLSAARNTGLSVAKGEYILFLDSDDLLLPNSLSPLLNEAIKKDVDLVIADFTKKTNEEISNNSFSEENNYLVSVTSGKELFLNNLDPRQCYVWRTIYKKSFIDGNHISFIPGIYFEDVPFTVECYLKARKCLKTTKLFYIYRQRENSIVSSINLKKLKDLNEVIASLWKMKTDLRLPYDFDRKLMDTIFATFSIAIWYIIHDKELLKQRRLYIEDLNKRVPNLKFNNGIKQKIVNAFFRKNPSAYIYLRSLC